MQIIKFMLTLKTKFFVRSVISYLRWLFMLQRATGNLVIEGKGDNNSLLSGIGEEISRILT